ncbi:transposase [Embleya sp. MST-111070]|uniref:transposase n=1 Tax=Embleya sp. MST-111070 TaxID=3398231 RepID=UPI003F736532
MDTLTLGSLGPGRGVHAGRPSKFTDEFKRDAVALYRLSGGSRTFSSVATELGVNAETLRAWVRQAEADAGERDDRLSTVEREELARLRKAEREWHREREILRRAAAYFAREMK